MWEENKENVIEWLTGQHTITCTFNQTKYVNKIKSLAKKHPDKVKILAENSDGSICAKLPIKSLKLSIIERELSEEDKQIRAERMRKLKEDKKNEKM